MPLPESPIMFANNPLDRAGHLRGNADWLAAQFADDSALFVPLWHLQPLILPELNPGDGRDVGWLPRPRWAKHCTRTACLFFLA